MVRYMSFEEMCDKIQKHFEFKIELPAPYKLCDYRPAYGEIFQDEIREYDFGDIVIWILYLVISEIFN